MCVIIVTGTPGTGKTTLSKCLAAKIHAKYLDLNKTVLSMGMANDFDKKRNCFIVDTIALKKQFAAILHNYSKKKKKWIIIDSHISHFLPNKLIDHCILTTCYDINELKTRLKSRGYSEEKVRENMDSEIFEICKIESITEGHTPVCIDTSKITIHDALHKALHHLKIK